MTVLSTDRGGAMRDRTNRKHGKPRRLSSPLTKSVLDELGEV